MFQNYSETYASQILALAGFAAVMCRMFGLEIAESDAVFVIGAVANVAGIVWAIVQRNRKGDVNALGFRKVR